MCKDFTSLGMIQEIIIARIDELVSTNIDNFNLLNIFNERNLFIILCRKHYEFILVNLFYSYVMRENLIF